MDVVMPNRSSTPKRPRDANQLAEPIVDIATGTGYPRLPLLHASTLQPSRWDGLAD